MRRSRNLREFRNELIKKRVKTVSSRRRRISQRIAQKKNKFSKKDETEVSEALPFQQPDVRLSMHERRRQAIKKARQQLKRRQPRVRYDPKRLSASRPSALRKFHDYDTYKATKLLNVLHIIDSPGLGGAQTMMMELVNALNKYYSKNIINYVVILGKDRSIKQDLFSSYGIEPIWVAFNKLYHYCEENSIDIVLHHRTAIARSVKQYLPVNVKYVLLNHTWNYLNRLSGFYDCDYFVSVCKFLHNKTKWEHFIDDSRKLIILNGVENDYIDELPDKQLPGKFKTGRCHRFVGSKFRVDSLTWFSKKVPKIVPGVTHFLIGSNSSAKAICKTSKNLIYFGLITNRLKKMAIIKQFDMYFYETFAHEGASMAILESLACGVPVMCFARGGNTELVTHGVNGFIVGDRSEALLLMQQMAASNFGIAMKKKAKDDFEKRLHIKHTACKYMQLFECVVEEKQ